MPTSSYDFLSHSERSKLMRRVRSAGTSPEQALAAALRYHAIPFESNCADLIGKPDFVIRKNRLLIFVDGEFWHGGQWHSRGLQCLAEQFPDKDKRNRWIAKINGNTNRDFSNTHELLKQGWTVIRFWAKDVERDPSAAIELIRRVRAGKLSPSAASLLPSRTVAEFFAGVGLVQKALDAAKWVVSFANDNAANKILFYKANNNEMSVHFDRARH